MNIIEWIVWGIGFLILIIHIPLYLHHDPSIASIFRNFAVLATAGLVVTVLTELSKLHLLWWIPVSYILKFDIFYAGGYWRVKRFLKEERERELRELDLTCPQCGHYARTRAKIGDNATCPICKVKFTIEASQYEEEDATSVSQYSKQSSSLPELLKRECSKGIGTIEQTRQQTKTVTQYSEDGEPSAVGQINSVPKTLNQEATCDTLDDYQTTETDGQLTSEQWEMVFQTAKKAGINTQPWWEAVPYFGPPKVLRNVLSIERGMFSKVLFVADNDLNKLIWLVRYIGHKKWTVSFVPGQRQLGHGDFVIFVKHAFRGGDRRPVIELLRSFGADQKLIDSTLNHQEEEIQGYVLSSTFKEARSLARTIEQGASNRVTGGHLT